MGEEPTPRQVLYGLVAAGFHLVVGVLAVASASLAPGWWNIAVAVLWAAVAILVAMRWRSTGMVLGVTVTTFILWTVGAAIVLT